MDNNQTTFKKGTVTHGLQQPSQETNPFSKVTSRGSHTIYSKSDVGNQMTISSNHPKNTNQKPPQNWSKMART